MTASDMYHVRVTQAGTSVYWLHPEQIEFPELDTAAPGRTVRRTARAWGWSHRGGSGASAIGHDLARTQAAAARAYAAGASFKPFICHPHQ